MLSTICINQILDNYYHGHYGSFSAVIDKENGYVNATKLCSDGGKNFKHWTASKIAKEMSETITKYNFECALIDEHKDASWSMSHYQPLGKVSYSIRTLNESEEDKLISGTYCHPLLIPHIACWVSPSFALKAASIINYFIIEEWRCRLQASELIHHERSNVIEQQNLELEQEKQALQAAIKDCEGVIHENLEQAQVKKEVISGLEENVAAKIMNRQKWASTHAFTFLKVGDGTSLLPYYAIRCQRSAMSGAINKLRRRHPRAEVIYHQNKIPNAVNLFTRLKDDGIILAKRNYCVAKHNNEQSLIVRMSELCGTTHPSCNVAPLNAHMQQ